MVFSSEVMFTHKKLCLNATKKENLFKASSKPKIRYIKISRYVINYSVATCNLTFVLFSMKQVSSFTPFILINSTSGLNSANEISYTYYDWNLIHVPLRYGEELPVGRGFLVQGYDVVVEIQVVQQTRLLGVAVFVDQQRHFLFTHIRGSGETSVKL